MHCVVSAKRASGGALETVRTAACAGMTSYGSDLDRASRSGSSVGSNLRADRVFFVVILGQQEDADEDRDDDR